KVIRKGIAFDEVLETKDSPPTYIRAMANPILKGDKIYKVSGVYQDVTEIKQKENDLTLYKTIIDNAQDLIYVYNDKGDLLHYSESLIDQLRSEEHTSELQSRENLVCRLLLEKKKAINQSQ